MGRYRFLGASIGAVIVSAVIGGLFGRAVFATDDRLNQQYKVFTAALGLVEQNSVEKIPPDRLVYSAPFVAAAIVRFLFLALWRPKDDSPTEAMFKDPWFLLILAGAVATILVIIYGR